MDLKKKKKKKKIEIQISIVQNCLKLQNIIICIVTLKKHH